MKNVIPVTEARKNIFSLVDDVDKKRSRFLLTDRGRAKAVIMSADEFDSWQETLEVMKDFPGLDKELKETRRDLASGKYKSYPTLEEVLGEQGFVFSDKVKKAYDLSNKNQAGRRKTAK